ncbi:MAG: LPS export ABC transporter permease LptF [Nitrospirae bacterium GWC2_57_9]|nr:MAG: LPS export ABC transporter permease LptF [Nitrospirae bacterium GWC2_57_9]
MFRIRILDRYILSEIVTPFFLGIAALTLVFLLQKMFRLAELVVSKGATLWSTAALFGYILPSFLVLTIPMSLLVATLTAFTRLGTDSEVTAMKASRISLYNMIRPVMLFAVAAFLVTAAMSLFIAPRANHQLKVHLFDMVKSKALVGIEPGIFTSTFDGMVVYVDKMASLDEMEGIFISDERSAKEPYAISARRGKLIADQTSLKVTFAMKQGAIHALPLNDQAYSTMTFDTGNLYLDINNALLPNNAATRDFDEIGSLELYEMLKRYRDEGRVTLGIESELQKRFSLPFACLLFGLIGAPLGIRRTRSGKSAGIALALLVFLVYYVLLATGTNLSNTGKLPPAVAYWTPNVIMTIAALVMVIKKGQELDFGLASRIAHAYHRIRSRRKKIA